jgi:hypothetical protein
VDHGDQFDPTPCWYRPGVIRRRTRFPKIAADAAPKDKVVAELDLREEEPMPAAPFLPFRGGKERREARQPFLDATH